METVQLVEVSPSLIALSRLKEGNQRFVNNLRINRNLLQEVEATKGGQEPDAVIISCMDSRTSPELIFDQGLGDIFSIRIAGNVITPEVIGSAEYACKVVGTKLIIVLGHLGCGAIKGAVDNVKLGYLPTITDRIRFSMKKNQSLDEITEENVKSGMVRLFSESAVLRRLTQENNLLITGGVYDINTGKVTFID